MQHGVASTFNMLRGRYAFVDCEPTYCIIGGLLFVPFSYAVCTLPFGP